MAALAMIFDAQDILNEIDTEYRLGGKLVQYATRSLGQRGLSAGQLLDLRTGGESRFTPSVDTLDNMAHLKTGLAIEMGLIGSALIAQQPPEIISRLQEYARHAGIAFQVKDDLLDVMSNESTLGKDCGADAKNHKPNYVSLLGVNDANSKLAHHLQQAKETITGLPKPIITRKFIEILDYIADRKM